MPAQAQASQQPSESAFAVHVTADGSTYFDVPPTHGIRSIRRTETTQPHVLEAINTRLSQPALAPSAGVGLTLIALLLAILFARSLLLLAVLGVLTGAGAAGVFFLHRRDQWRRTTRLHFTFDMAGKARYADFLENSGSLTTAQVIWEIKPHLPQDWQFRQPAKLVKRQVVQFGISAPPHLKLNQRVFGLRLRSLRLYFLPDVILVYRGRRYTAIRYADLDVSWSRITFTEEKRSVPRDSRVVKHAWRSREFPGNREYSRPRRIPVVEYGQIHLFSLPMFPTESLSVLLHVSNLRASRFFVMGLGRYADVEPEFSEQRSADGRYAGGVDDWASDGAQRAYDERGAAHTTAPDATPYDILGVPPSAAFAEVQKAYRKLAHKYHPDKVLDQPPDVQRYAAEKMKAINEAYAEVRRMKAND